MKSGITEPLYVAFLDWYDVPTIGAGADNAAVLRKRKRRSIMRLSKEVNKVFKALGTVSKKALMGVGGHKSDFCPISCGFNIYAPAEWKGMREKDKEKLAKLGITESVYKSFLNWYDMEDYYHKWWKREWERQRREKVLREYLQRRKRRSDEEDESLGETKRILSNGGNMFEDIKLKKEEVPEFRNELSWTMRAFLRLGEGAATQAVLGLIDTVAFLLARCFQSEPELLFAATHERLREKYYLAVEQSKTKRTQENPKGGETMVVNEKITQEKVVQFRGELNRIIGAFIVLVKDDPLGQDAPEEAAKALIEALGSVLAGYYTHKSLEEMLAITSKALQEAYYLAAVDYKRMKERKHV